MTLQVIQWATGGLGQAAIAGIVAHPDLELAGAWVHSPDKEGRDAGDLAGIDPVGVAATRDVDALLALGADCVALQPRRRRRGRGRPPAGVGAERGDAARLVLPRRARRHRASGRRRWRAGSTLHGTGIHPGGITERFPLMVSALSARITHVRAEEFSDIRSYGAPDVVRHIMLFGATPEEAAASPMVRLLGSGFLQSVDMVADTLGFRVDPEHRTDHEVAVATRPIDSPIGAIEPGRVAAQRFTWQATVDGEPVITVRTNWFMGQEHLDPAWTFGPEGERFEVEITGDPSSLVTFHGWHPETIAPRASPATPASWRPPTTASAPSPRCARAEPGIRTYLDLPLVAGRAAPTLAR